MSMDGDARRDEDHAPVWISIWMAVAGAGYEEAAESFLRRLSVPCGQCGFRVPTRQYIRGRTAVGSLELRDNPVIPGPLHLTKMGTASPLCKPVSGLAHVPGAGGPSR